MEVLAYTADGGTLLGVVPKVSAATGMEELEGQGGGSVTVPLEVVNQNPSWFAVRNVMKVVVDNRTVAAWVVRRRESVLVGADLIQSVQFSGPGLLSWLEDAVLHHEFPTPYSAKTRWFNWGALATGSTGWGAPTKVRKRGGADFTDQSNPFRKKPANWPDMGDVHPWWVWDRKSDDTAPVGWVYFRRTFDVADNGSLFTLYVTANNWCHVILDGEPLALVRERRGYRKTFEIDIELDAGTHVLGIAAKNKGRFAGMIAALLQFEDDDDETGVPVFWTGQPGWKCLGYPAETPGWTAGKMLRTLLLEADARGVSSVGRLSPTFSDTSDSSGGGWDAYGFSFDVGMSYWEIAQDLLDYGVQVAASPSGSFSAFVERGFDRRASVFLDVVAHLTEATDSIESAVKNALLVETKDGWETRTDSGSLGSYGRIEGYVDLSQLSDKRVDRVVAATFKKSKIPVEGVTASFVPSVGNVPWLDFGVGDYVSVSQPNGGYKARKVISIAVSKDADTGLPMYAVELDAISKDRLDKLQRIIDSTGMAMGTLAGTTPKKNRGKSPGDNDSPGDHRNPRSVDLPPGGIDLPPDDPGFDDPEGEFDVGDVSMPVGNEMSNAWKQFGTMELALLSSEPTAAGGVWLSIDGHELTAGGYERGTIDPDDLSDPGGHDPVVVKTTTDVTCGTNDSGSAWPDITHAALLAGDGSVMAVTAFTLPAQIADGQSATFLSGDVQFVVGTV